MPFISIIDVAAYTDALGQVIAWVPALGWSIWSLLPGGWHIPSGADM